MPRQLVTIYKKITLDISDNKQKDKCLTISNPHVNIKLYLPKESCLNSLIDIGKGFLRIAQKIVTKDKTVKFVYREIKLFMTPNATKSKVK